MLTATQPAVVKKYSCMYTTDLQKHRKVWHDGFLRIRHLNSKVSLISEEGHTLAESFLKSSLLKGSTTETTRKDSDELLSYMKVPPQFELYEDQEIEFDPVEDSESRPSCYMARIVTLIKIETENIPLMTPLNSKAKQDLHKRKMEILDQTIHQLSKRPKMNGPIMNTPFSGVVSPSTPIPSSSRRKLAAGFETRPFNSPLMNKSKSSKTKIHQSNMDTFPTPIKSSQDVEEHNSSSLKPNHDHQKSTKSVVSKPILEPIHPSFTNMDPIKSCHTIQDQPVPLKNDVKLNKSNHKLDEDDGQIIQSIDHLSSPKTSVPLSNSTSDASANNNDCFERISKKKTLKINWDSYFKPANSSS